MTYRNATRDTTRRQLTSDDWNRIQRLYEGGALDIEIAEEVGCASKTIARWRWAEELPRNDRAVEVDS